MSIYSDLRVAVNDAAKALDSAGKPLFTTADIAEWIRTNLAGEWPRFEPSFQVNYSALTTRDPDCIVERVPGRFLYQIARNDEVSTVADGEECAVAPQLESDATTVKTRLQRESKLYQLLRDWLESRGFQAAVTASGKRGGTWGNPDVTGIRIDELPLGQVHFECATLEAKLTSDDWRYWLFEAVAHKRFAHRAYYAFAVGTDSPSLDRLKDAEKMCEYAEKYRIGILVVFISKQHYETLTTGDASTVSLGPDDARIETLWPAFYEQVQVPALNEYMTDVLGIRSIHDLRRFGDSE